MTKTTLLAAASAAAIFFAGAAQAGTITGTVNDVAVGADLFYTIAKERTDAADSTGVNKFVVINAITATAKPVIAIGAPAQTFQVTFDITGGTIQAAAAATVVVNQVASNGATTLGAPSVVQGARSATSITFIVTVNAPTGVADPANFATINGFTLTTTADNSAAEANIAVASTVAVSAGGVTSTIDSTAARTLVRYVNVLAPFSATAKSTKASLPEFKFFTNAGIPTAAAATLSDGADGVARTAQLGSAFVVATAVTGNAGASFHAGLNGAAVAAGDILSGGTLTISGAFPTHLKPALSNGGTLTQTATSAVFALTDGQVDTLAGANFALTQTATLADQRAIPAGSYTAAFAPILATGYTAPASGSANVGTITLDGTNFIAPWFSGSQAQTQSQIRLSNTGATNATVRVSITNGVFNFNGSQTAFGDAACGTGAFILPVNGDLVLSNAAIKACFGDFLRGDLLISVEAAGAGVTAKMRNTSANGTFETTLGRFSGGVASDAAQ